MGVATDEFIMDKANKSPVSEDMARSWLAEFCRDIEAGSDTIFEKPVHLRVFTNKPEARATLEEFARTINTDV